MLKKAIDLDANPWNGAKLNMDEIYELFILLGKPRLLTWNRDIEQTQPVRQATMIKRKLHF